MWHAGGASAETIRTYWCEVKQYLQWCEVNQLQPLEVTRDAIKIYRHHLVQQKYKPATICPQISRCEPNVRCGDGIWVYSRITPSGA